MLLNVRRHETWRSPSAVSAHPSVLFERSGQEVAPEMRSGVER